MILNNAPCHKAYSMSILHFAFLLPDCTGVLQPLNTGMIQSVKAHYQKHQVCHIEKINKGDISPIFLHDVVCMIKKHGMKFLQKLLLTAGNVLD